MKSLKKRTHGALPAEGIKGKSGREILQGIVDGTLPSPPISESLTFELVEVGDGFAAFEGETGPHLLNPAGTVHGGWALTLIDSATGCAAYTKLGPDTLYTTVETKANFVRPIMHNTGRVRAEAHVISAGRQIITTECKVFGPDKKILASGTSTLIVLQNRG